MEENNKFKKAFTLVELIVVIAIVAILAAVSVFSYMAFVRQANESADIQLVKQLNIALQADEALSGKRDTMYDMLQGMEKQGFVVENLTKTKSGYDIVWDEKGNRFALLNNQNNVLYSEDSFKNKEDYKVWTFVDNLTEIDKAESKKYSVYLTEEFVLPTDGILEVHTGVDTGKYRMKQEINEIYYNNSSATSGQTVTIRTGSYKTNLKVNAPLDTVNHYYRSGKVLIESVNPTHSYHEFGDVVYVEVRNGLVVFESTASVDVLYSTASTNVSFKLKEGGSIEHAHTTTSELKSLLDAASQNSIEWDYDSDNVKHYENWKVEEEVEKLIEKVQKEEEKEYSETCTHENISRAHNDYWVYENNKYLYISDYVCEDCHENVKVEHDLAGVYSNTEKHIVPFVLNSLNAESLIGTNTYNYYMETLSDLAFFGFGTNRKSIPFNALNYFAVFNDGQGFLNTNENQKYYYNNQNQTYGTEALQDVEGKNFREIQQDYENYNADFYIMFDIEGVKSSYFDLCGAKLGTNEKYAVNPSIVEIYELKKGEKLPLLSKAGFNGISYSSLCDANMMFLCGVSFDINKIVEEIGQENVINVLSPLINSGHITLGLFIYEGEYKSIEDSIVVSEMTVPLKDIILSNDNVQN